MSEADYKISNIFFELNKKFWPEIPNYNSSFLVDLLIEEHEYYNISLITARGLSEVLKANPVALVSSRNNKDLVKLIESYGIKKIIYFEDFRISGLLKYRLIAHALLIWLAKRTKNALLSIKYKKMLIGHFIYDSHLALTGCGTPSLCDLRYAKFIYWGLKTYNQFEKIFDSENYQLYFGIEQTGVEGGIPSSVAISRGIKVFYRKSGLDKVMYRSYTKEEDLDISPAHIRESEFASELKGKEEKAIAWSDNYLKNLFGGKVDPADWAARQAYEKTQGITDENIKKLSIGKYRHCVFVFTHVFVDAPHTYRKGIFPDYQVWLEKTLKIAKKRKDTLWIVKIHPCENFFNSKIKASDVCRKFLSSKNIKILPENITPASLVKYIDAVVTVRGTAIVEYSSMGKPVVVAGDGRFNEGDFCIEPRNKKEYRKILMEENFARLSKEKINKAKIYLYLIQNMGRIDLPLFLDVDLSDSLSFNPGTWSVNPEKIYSHLIQKLQTTSYQKEMSDFYKNYIIKKLTFHDK